MLLVTYVSLSFQYNIVYRYPISYDEFAGAVATSQAVNAAEAACKLLSADAAGSLPSGKIMLSNIITRVLTNLLSNQEDPQAKRVTGNTAEMLHVLKFTGTRELFAAAGFKRVEGSAEEGVFFEVDRGSEEEVAARAR